MTKNAAKPKSLLIDGWEVVIGIEIHTQLATQSKIFSGSSTEFGQDPNTQASLVDLAMPGVLPVLNKEVVDLAIRFGLGIDAYIDQASVFARKNYFYPDSPKGYQISCKPTGKLSLSKPTGALIAGSPARLTAMV
jgi:aspartyl-tRNA(Asn)/glutamyl-tRNA(Gln) amidotransferase subunit B